MKTALGVRYAVAVAAVMVVNAAHARAQDVAYYAPQYTSEELENLLAPIALYPDPILAQVLVAASYPEQVELAAQYLRTYGQYGIDDQPWDISVRAVAHYKPVLNLMADRVDWMTALGQAYAAQPNDVMAAVQSLRAMARAHGNLITTPEHEVVVEDRYIRILPAQPRVVYVPVYDPYLVYYRPIVHFGVYRSGWSFGFGFPIGVWLTYDLDWRHRNVFYHGWDPFYDYGWIYRSRPFIVINNIYVRPRPTVVVVNRTVVNRYVDYGGFDKYNYVHRQTRWDRAGRAYGEQRYAGAGPSWDRDGRADGGLSGLNGDRNPSWDRAGRARAAETRASDDNERRAVPRSSGSASGTVRGATPQSERAQPQRVLPQRSEPQRTQPRLGQPRQAQPQRAEPQRTQPERVQPQRSEPQRIQSQRVLPQRSEPRQAQPRAAQPQRSEPRGQLQRQSSPQRLENRAPAPRQQPRAEPQRVQTRQQPQPQRIQSQPQRIQSQSQRTPSQPQRIQSQRTGSIGSQSRAQPERRVQSSNAARTGQAQARPSRSEARPSPSQGRPSGERAAEARSNGKGRRAN